MFLTSPYIDQAITRFDTLQSLAHPAAIFALQFDPH